MLLAENNGMHECSPRTAGRPAGRMRGQACLDGRGGMGGLPHVAKRFWVGASLAHKVTRLACMLTEYAHKVVAPGSAPLRFPHGEAVAQDPPVAVSLLAAGRARSDRLYLSLKHFGTQHRFSLLVVV